VIVRIYWGKVVAGAWPVLEDRYRSLNRLKVPGLLGRMVAQDVNDSESMLAITYWQDLASVLAWESSDAFRTVFRAAVEPYLAGSQTVSLCEVKVGDLPPATPIT